MSAWLRQLPIQSTLAIGSINNILDPMPEWAAFMIWYGWWQRQNILINERLISLLVVPDRSYCSALCSFGALLSSAKNIQNEISWEDFLALPKDFEIYFKDCGKNISGVLGDISLFEGVSTRAITPINKSKKHSNSIIYVMEGNFRSKSISLVPHVNQQNIGAIIDFYKTIVVDFDKAWIASMVTECRVATNKAQWNRNLDDLVLFTKDTSLNDHYLPCNINWLLFTKNNNAFTQAKTSVITPKSLSKITSTVSVAIYDGIDALQYGVNNISKSNNSIFILSTEEYDENSYELISLLSQYRSNRNLVLSHEIPGITPKGIEAIVFSLHTNGAM